MELFYALSGLINGVISSILGCLVYFKNRKNKVNRIFALVCLSVAAWSYCYYFWPGAVDKINALFWFRALHIGAIFIPVCFLHFVITWLNKHKGKRKIVILGYLVSFIFLAFNFTPLFIKDMVPKFSFRYWAEPGILYHFFLLYFFVYAFYACYLLFVAYRVSSGVRRDQIRYMLIGSIIGYLGGSTNYPLWYNIPILPVGTCLFMVFIVLVTFAIVKHHLMGIRVILTEVLVTVIGLILLVQATLAKGLWDIVFKVGILILFSYFGFLLIKAVVREVERRREVERLAKELETANVQLKQFDQAKSDFVSITSHQLRTPISGIKGYLSMILEGDFGKITGKQEKVIKMNLSNIERLIRLIDLFLNITKIEAGRLELRKEKIQIEDLIEKVISNIKNLAVKKGLELKLVLPPEKLPLLFVDPDKIEDVIMNLIDNAIKYSEKGRVIISVGEKEGKVLVQVKDTGMGIPKEEVPLLFAKFSRGRRLKLLPGGTGLGLYIVKQLVEIHGGKAWVESEGEGKGSAFSFSLPIN